MATTDETTPDETTPYVPGMGADLQDTLVSQAEEPSKILTDSTKISPEKLVDSTVTGTELKADGVSSTAPTADVERATTPKDVVAPVAPTPGEYDVTAATTVGKTPTAEAAQLTQDEISPEVKIGNIQGTLSEGATAVAAQTQVQEQQLVSYQLGELYASIEEGKPLPAWASGPVRAATSVMQARGLGASSMAAAAVSQAVLEAGLPIAAADAAEYSKINIANLNNRQAAALQNAATLAQMDLANLDARMKAAVQNAQSFLAIDLQNLSNEQATETLNYQGQLQALFTDAAAENATRQFNAKNQAQVDQFFAELGVQVDNANANRVAAMEQFNVDQVNSTAQFNASMEDARERFNSTMQMQINQSNAQWRRDIATADTAAANEAQRQNALNTLEISQNALAALWQRYRDESAWVMTSAENAAARAHQMAMLEFEKNANTDMYEMQAEYETAASVGNAAVAATLGLIRG